MLYFWKASGSRMTNMTFPSINPIQLVPRPFNSSPKCQKNCEQEIAWKTQHMLYFWKAGGSRMTNMTFLCIKCKIHKYANYTYTKCLQDATCAIFLKSWWFKDINYDHHIIISSYQFDGAYRRPMDAIFYFSPKALHTELFLWSICKGGKLHTSKSRRLATTARKNVGPGKGL